MLLWLPGCLLILALYEYAGHRWPLHQLRRTRGVELAADHRVHHRLYAVHFESDEVPAWYDALWVRGLIAATWSASRMTPVFLWLSKPLAVVFALAAIVHGVFWQWVHVQMHQPSCAWLIRTRYYRFVRDFHAVHHRQPQVNFGFVLPSLCDWAFGTYRRRGAGAARPLGPPRAAGSTTDRGARSR